MDDWDIYICDMVWDPSFFELARLPLVVRVLASVCERATRIAGDAGRKRFIPIGH